MSNDIKALLPKGMLFYSKEATQLQRSMRHHNRTVPTKTCHSRLKNVWLIDVQSAKNSRYRYGIQGFNYSAIITIMRKTHLDLIPKKANTNVSVSKTHGMFSEEESFYCKS